MVKKYRYPSAFLFLFLINISSANQGYELKSNLKLLENILDSTLIELIEQDVLNGKDTVFVQVIADDTTFSSIQKSILTDFILNQHNIAVFSNSDKIDLSGKRIVFRWVEWSIYYTEMKQKFWQKQKFQRNLTADFFVEVLSRKNNKILFSKNVKKDNISQIKSSDIPKIENPDYAFTLGKIVHKKSILKKWIKPVFLFAISGAVVYLFYSVRTQ